MNADALFLPFVCFRATGCNVITLEPFSPKGSAIIGVASAFIGVSQDFRAQDRHRVK